MYSRYIAKWEPGHGVVFAEPVRKSDEKLFTHVTCVFCHDKFYVDRSLKPAPQACERCTFARRSTNPDVPAVPSAHEASGDHKIQIPER